MDTINMTKVITWQQIIIDTVYFVVVHKAVYGMAIGGIQNRTKDSW